jgi:4'-phosphopantetheinyl transferase EntD
MGQSPDFASTHRAEHRCHVIERLLPATVAVVSTRRDLPDINLYAEEEQSIGRAVQTRRREFTTARSCARMALQRLGVASVAIPTGQRGEPLWPRGVVGSITHCRGYRACAVARSNDLLALGIDAELHAPLPDGVLEQVAFGRELTMVSQNGGTGLYLDRVLFSAKEAVYKAWFPLAHRWLGFEDVDLTIDVSAGAFHARLFVSGPVVDGVRLTEFRGRWCVNDGIVGAAVTVFPTGVAAKRPRPLPASNRDRDRDRGVTRPDRRRQRVARPL